MSALVRVPGEAFPILIIPSKQEPLPHPGLGGSDFTSLLWNLEFQLLTVSEFSAENKNDPSCKLAV